MSVFNNIYELMAKNNYNAALNLLMENQKELFLIEPINTIKVHFELLLELGYFHKCYEVLEEYKSYPYQNMDVEEFIIELNNNLPKMIEKRLRSLNKNPKEIDYSNKMNVISFLKDLINKNEFNTDDFNITTKILNHNISDEINFMCLNVLYKIDKTKVINCTYKRKKCTLELSKIHFPFSKDDVEFYKIISKLESDSKNISILDCAKELLVSLRVEIFPSFFHPSEINEIFDIVTILSKKLYFINVDEDKFKDNKYYNILLKLYFNQK